MLGLKERKVALSRRFRGGVHKSRKVGGPCFVLGLVFGLVLGLVLGLVPVLVLALLVWGRRVGGQCEG